MRASSLRRPLPEAVRSTLVPKRKPIYDWSIKSINESMLCVAWIIPLLDEAVRNSVCRKERSTDQDVVISIASVLRRVVESHIKMITAA
jgi:hypothetical protein